MNDPPGDASDVVLVKGQIDRAVDRLRTRYFEGMVMNCLLDDGSETWGVLVGTSSSVLIFDRWDDEIGFPTGELFIVELHRIERVGVP